MNKTRIHALDGLRGFAMILVFLNHINPTFLITSFPFLDFLGIFSSGVTGVTFLFILSGFLMYSLYPSPDTWKFIQKRYTRIFPLFLSMCCVMLVFFLFPTLFWGVKLTIIALVALATHAIWVWGIKKINNQMLSRSVFFGFFTLQMLIAGVYVFWIMRHPPIYLQHFLSPYGSAVFTGLVNATLTFPLGNYIPMIDGVYWSLASEVLFYVIYPLLLIPLIFLLSQQRRVVKILFLLTLLPFLGAVDMMSHHILVLSALQPALFYYFATGILLAHLYKNHQAKLQRFSNAFLGQHTFLSLSLLAIIFVGQHYISSISSSSVGPWMRLFFAIPCTMLVALLLQNESFLTKIFRSKFFVFIGTISYSIYLSHAAVIEITSSFFHATNMLTNLLFILLSFLMSVIIASILYLLLEKPYFIKKPKQTLQTITPMISYKKTKMLLLGISAVSIVALFFAFQSDYNFFSLVISHPPSSVILPHTRQSTPVISLKEHPSVIIQIPSYENNLGIISLALTHYQKKKQPSSFLTVTIRQEGKPTPLSTTVYGLDEFHGVNFPFGFPQVTDSKNKTYQVLLTLAPIVKDNYLLLDPGSIKTMYQLNKSQFLTHPRQLFTLLASKMQTIVEDKEARLVFYLLLPFVGLSLFLCIKRNHSG